MAISKNQSMREAEIDIIDTLDETNDVLGQLSDELEQEIETREATTRIVNQLVERVEEIPIIEYGEFEHTQAAQTDGLVTISFAQEKNNVPKIIISLACEENNFEANCYAVVTNVNTEGFTARIYNLATESANINLIWAAIGE